MDLIKKKNKIIENFLYNSFKKLFLRLKLKLSVLSVSALDKFCDKVKVIGPNGDIQLSSYTCDDLILLLSSMSYRNLHPKHFQNLKINLYQYLYSRK